MNKYYTGEPVNIHIQSLINIMQENNIVINKKKGKGKLPLFRGNGKWVIPIYGDKDRNVQASPNGYSETTRFEHPADGLYTTL